ERRAPQLVIGRHDTDHGVVLVVHAHLFAKDVRIALVAGVPEGIADDDDVRRSRSVFTGEEGPAENRLDTSIAGSVRANGSAIDGFGMSVVREVEHDVLEDGGVLEDVSELTDIVVLRDREKPGTSLLAIEACEDGDPAAVIFEIERKNKRGFPHAVE